MITDDYIERKDYDCDGNDFLDYVCKFINYFESEDGYFYDNLISIEKCNNGDRLVDMKKFRRVEDAVMLGQSYKALIKEDDFLVVLRGYKIKKIMHEK